MVSCGSDVVFACAAAKIGCLKWIRTAPDFPDIPWIASCMSNATGRIRRHRTYDWQPNNRFGVSQQQLAQPYSFNG
jgi:hypothetical protein